MATKIQQVICNNIPNNPFTASETEQQFHEEFLEKLYRQKRYEGVLILNEDGRHQYCDNFLEYLKFKELPTTVITGNVSGPYRDYFNHQVLSIVCMTTYQYNILEQLAQIFNNMRYTRIIIVMTLFSNKLDANALRDFLHYSNKLKMLNVLIIFKDFFTIRKYVQFTIFPEFRMEFGGYDPNTPNPAMLADRLRNLKGYKLRSIVDHTQPRAMEYYNEHNETVLNGYIGRFVQIISETLNASLHFPLQIPHDQMVDYRDILEYVTNYSLDIPASSLSMYETDDPLDFSYPFEMGKWCVLLPMEKPIDFKELFLIVMHSQIMFIILILFAVFSFAFYLVLCRNPYHQRQLRWSEIIINDAAIRGVLGQGFAFSAYKSASLKLIYTMVMLSGLTISTVFACYLLSYCTQPPLEPEIKTYQDLAKSHLKVAIAWQEFQYLHNITNGSLAYMYPNFYIVAEFSDFSKLRDSFDRRFAYPTVSSKLFYYNSLQAYFNKKFFRFSAKMCPSQMLQFVFPLGSNSYFKTRLHEVILNILQSGLLEYWMSYSYQDVVATGTAIHVNISYPAAKRPLYFQDLYWIWLYYLISIVFAVVVFILELLINKMFRN